MLKILCYLIILGTYKKCHGIFTERDDSRRELHPRWNDFSQNQNKYSYHTENGQIAHSENEHLYRSENNHLKSQIEFGMRLKPRVRQISIPSEHLAERKKNLNFYNQMRTSGKKLQNRKRLDINPTPLEILEYSDFVQYTSKNKRLITDTAEIFKSSSSETSKNLLENNSLNSLEIHDLQNAENQGFGRRVSRNDINRFNQNTDSKKRNGHFIAIKTKPTSLISFRSKQTPNGQYISPFRNKYRQKHRPNFEVQNQNTFESNCTASSNILYIRKPGSNTVNVNGQNTFKGPDYLPPLVETRVFKGEEYLPPVTETSKTCHNCGKERPITTFITTKRPNVATRHPIYIKPIVKHPFYTKNTTNKPDNTQTTNEEPRDNLTPPKRPYCSTCVSTTGPLYIPVTEATPNPSKSNVTESPNVEYTKDITKEDTLKTTTVKISRGDIPDDEDYTEDTTTSIPSAGPAMAKPVPPEPDKPVTTMKSTNFLPTVTLTTISNIAPPNMPDTTKFSIPTDSTTERVASMSNTDDNRHLTDEESLSVTYKTVTTTPVPFKAPEYLPPDEPNMPVLNMNSADAEHAMAMPIPPKPEEEVSPPMTMISPSKMTTSVSTTTNDNRHLCKDDSSITPMNAMETTTIFKGSDYLPPEEPITIMPAIPAPAMAMPVPPEPEEAPISTPSPTKVSTPPNITSTAVPITESMKTSQTVTIADNNRHLLENTSRPTTPMITLGTTIFKGSEYLPPKKSTTIMTAASAASTTTATNLNYDTSSTPIETTTIFHFKGSEYLPPDESTTNSPAAPLPGPALAMPVPPELADDATPTPSTTTASTTTITSSTISTTTSTKTSQPVTTSDNNRHLLEQSTPIPIETTTLFKGPEYLPPVGSTKKMPLDTTLPDPALAPETPDSKDVPSPSTTVSTDNADASPTPNQISVSNPFKGPEYLPPKEVLPPSPATSVPTDCSPDPNDSPNIDPRSSVGDPCMPTTSKTKKSFKESLYLPLKTKVVTSL